MKVSILIPCYNAETTVATAVESALSQTHQNIDVLVYDDGSTDGSLEQLKKFGDDIKWIAGSNRGAPAARNELLKQATGDWIQFLDADDTLKPTKLERQIQEVADAIEQADVVYSPVIEDGPSGQRVYAIDPIADPWTHWFQWRLGQPGGVLWRASALKRIGGWKVGLRCCQDNELCLRALKHGLRFAYAPTPGAYYRVWSQDSISRSQPHKVITEKTALLDVALDWLRQQDRLEPEHVDAAETAMFAMSRTLAQQDLKLAQQYYRQRKRLGLRQPRQSVATPALYRFALRYLGFANAERIAATTRHLQPKNS